MAARTGLQAFTKICQKACKLLAVWQPSILAAINGSSLSSEDKVLAAATISAINSSCDAFNALMVKWEK